MGQAGREKIMLRDYAALIRPEEWVLTFFILVFGYVLAGNASPSHINAIMASFISFFSIGAFGFIINDWFDRDYDKKKAGNRNPMSKGLISKKPAIILASLLGISGMAVSYLVIPQVFFLFLLSFVLLILYSAQPFRLKETAFLDIMTNSFPMPILFLTGYMLFGNFSFPALLVAAGLFLLGLATGLIQEIRDHDTDRNSGFSTTVVRIGVRNSINLLRIIFVLFIAMYFITVYMYFPLYFLILAASLYSYMKLIFSGKLRPGISTSKLNEVNHKSHLTLIFLIILILILYVN